MDLVVGLVCVEHAVEPREELLGAVVRVEDDGDLVEVGDVANVLCDGDGTGNGGLLLVVGDTLSSDELGTTLRALDDDGRLCVHGCLERCVGGGGAGDVEGWDGESVLSGIVEDLVDVLASDDAGRNDFVEACVCGWGRGRGVG